MRKKKTFNSLEEALAAPEDVILLRISDQDDFDQYSSELGQFPNIVELQLYNLVSTSLPAELGQLGTLKKIEMIHTQFQRLPPEIGQLHNLQTLYIFSNKATFQLPAQIGQLQNLKTLRIEHCGLYELPDEIGALTNLRRLSLPKNHLKQLPGTIGNLKKLRRLDLTSNRLRVLPPEIGGLKSLTILQIEKTRLKRLPDEIGALTKLEEIYGWTFDPYELSPAVRYQIKRLGGAILAHNEEPEPVEVRTAKGKRNLPEPLRCFVFDVQWPDDVIFKQRSRTFPYEVNFYGMEVRSHYIQVDKRSFYSIGDNDHQYFYFVPLESSDRGDPWVYLVDHEGEEYRPSKMPLSKFLTGLKTVKKKQLSKE